MSRRILVTGGCGLIGSAVVERILAAGGKALVLDNLSGEEPAAAVRAWLEGRGVEYVVGEGRYYHVDLARPWEDVMAGTSRRFVRKNVNLARNRLARAGGYDVETTTSWGAERVLAEAGPLHAAGQGVPSLPAH